MNTHTIWIIDDDQSIRWVIDKALKQANYKTATFETAANALVRFKKGQHPDCIISDLRMPGIDGFEFLKQIKALAPNLPIIIMTAYSDLDTTVQAYQDGAFEYLTKPFDISEVIALADKACNQIKQKTSTRKSTTNIPLSDQIIGESPALQEVFRVIGRLSKSHINVLIHGESGTGKELVAQALHTHSPRSEEAFIAINTAAIPKNLLESELFGHEKGAFPGATEQRIGRFEQANEGTLFLDEIGDMPMDLQTRLLRVLAEGEFYRVGGNTAIKANVRIIAATHQSLKLLVDQNLFRNDLYHRLNVIRLQLPALRERKEDIPLLLKHFLQISAKELNVNVKKIPEHIMNYLTELNWPGNVRQLENTCRWFSVMATGDEISMEDMPEDLINTLTTSQPSGAPSVSNVPLMTEGTHWTDLLSSELKQEMQQGHEDLIKTFGNLFEKTLLDNALKYTNGRKQDAARVIGWGRNTITRKIKELEV